MKLYPLLLLVLMLSACSSSQKIEPFAGIFKFHDVIFQYEISLPRIFEAHGSSGVTIFSGDRSDHSFWNGLNIYGTGAIMISVFQSSTSLDCSALGASKQSTVTSGDVSYVWGKVDIYDHLGIGDLIDIKQDPPCRGNPAPSAAYIFCATKGNKRVALCIDQASDDPKLAEEIFTTFHWTTP